MDGRWKSWLASAILLGLVGCTRSNTVPATQGPYASSKPKVEEKPKEGPPSPDTLVAMGDTHLGAVMQGNHSPAEREGLLNKASEEYQQALQRDPKNLRAYGGMAELFTYLGDKEKALETYDRAAQVFPKNGDVLVAKAICYKHFNDRINAIKALHAATQVNPADRRLRINLAFELAMAGQYEEAMTWFEKNMTPPQAHYSLAKAYAFQGKMVEAQRELQAALQIDGNYAPAHEMLAELTAPKGPENGSGIKTVGFEELSSIPEYRLAPNAKRLPPIEPLKSAAGSTPAAALIQTPEVISETPPKLLPQMPGNGSPR